jgi:tetratricopeptide (TPR) repeat protein
MRALFRAVLGALLCAGVAAAQEKLDTPEQAADKVLAAFEATDQDALKALAEKDEPDPWIVADELCLRGEHDAADAFARAAARPDTNRLPEYIASRRKVGATPEVREAFASAREAFRSKDYQKALELSRPATGGSDTVAGVRLRLVRGSALRALRRWNEGATAMREAAEAARSLGWLVKASYAFGQSAYASWRAGDRRAVLSAVEAQLRVVERIGDRYGIGRLHFDMGFHLLSGGRLRDAEGHLTRALAIFRELEKEPDIARTLIRIGDVHRRRGDAREALGRFQAALEICRRLQMPRDSALALHYLGNVQHRLGRPDRAWKAYEESLRIKRELGDRLGIAYTLNGQGNLKKETGDYPAALRLYEESLLIKRELGDKPGIAVTVGNIGQVQVLLGDHPAALRSFREALALARELGNKATIGLNLDQIGVVQKRLGNYRAAVARYEEALRYQREAGNRSGIAVTLGNVGVALRHLGDYPGALRCQEEALALHRETGNRRGEAIALGNLGILQKLLGNFSAALDLYESSLAIDREIEDTAGVASALNKIGVVLQHLGDYDKAIERHEEALGIYRALRNAAGVSAAIASMGTVQMKRGRHAEALACFRQALRIKEELHDRTGRARLLCNIGSAERGLGDPEAALRAFERALELAEETRHADTCGRSRAGLAEVYLEQGRPEAAAGAARRGVENVMDLSESLAEEEGAGVRDLFAGLFYAGCLGSLRAGRTEDLLWFLEQGRAASLREALGSRAALEDALIPADLLDGLNLARGAERRALAGLRAARGTGKLEEIRAARSAWEAARTEVQRIAGRIEREAKAAAKVTHSDPDDLETIRKHVGADEALVIYGLTSAEALALVVRPAGVSRVPLADSETIVRTAWALLGGERRVDPERAPALRRLIVEPLRLPKAVKRVLVSSAPGLGTVPFALLFSDREVVQVPSGTTLGLLREARADRGETVLAFGDPDYGTAVHETSLRIHRGAALLRLPPLPAAREEATAVADVAILGRQASETGLPGAITRRPRWRAVHFACHGLIHQESPRLSCLALTADEQNDGLLTALEILRLRVPADLVVLSACDTGRGKVYRTEGVVGLTRAFLYAGAARVIVSLWKVDDEATRALMVKFYELWNPKDGSQGLPTATALKRAQEYVASHEKWKHPYYWAAWQLWGLPD